MRRWDAVVIGGGPAGLTAGFYLSRAGFRTLLIERELLGGQAARIPVLFNYPGFPDGVRGRSLMARIERQALRCGLKVRRGEVTRVRGCAGRFRVVLGKAEVPCRAVIAATGSEFKSLGVPGESELWGRGVFHAPFGLAARFKGKVVAVAGGGETAAHQALALARYARKVVMIVRGSGIKAIAPLREGVRRHPRITVKREAVVRRLHGDRRLERLEWAYLKGDGPRRMDADALFVLVGKRPRRVRGGRGVYRAGDAREGNPRQVAAAAADGMARAMECERLLWKL